jgi:MFS family permease
MNFAVIVANRVVDAADVSLFPSMYKSISQEFKIGPQILGQILLSQTIARSISSPIWGFLADRMSKRKLLSSGCFIWGISTFGSGFSGSIQEFFIWRIICGIGLGCVSPIMQSLIADNAHEDQVGRAFGLLSIAGMIGSVFGVLLGTNLTNWRLPFYIVGILSIILGYIDLLLITESRVVHNKTGFSTSQLTLEVYQIFKKKTILIVMLQGVIGTVPWIALSFMTLFFQSIGFTNSATTFLTVSFGLGAGFGGYIGGIIGDTMHSLFPYRGRVYTAQMSVFLGIPLVWIIFGVLDPAVENYYYYWFCLSILGLVCSWCSTGCNRPLFIDIVPAELRSTAISWVVAVDDSLAGLAAPVVGLLAEKYGYIKTDSYNAEIYATNAEALRKSLYQTTTYPWMFCFLSYTLLYYTYIDEVKQVKHIQSYKMLPK